MKLLGILTDEDVLGASHVDQLGSGHIFREAARAVVLNDSGEIALINVTRNGYHKLPGGGIEDGESNETALRRECREEIGRDIEILGELGQIDELRVFRNQKQISYCYLAKAIGEKMPLRLTEKEKGLGQHCEWIPAEKAKAFMDGCAPKCRLGKFIVMRDSMFLREALHII